MLRYRFPLVAEFLACCGLLACGSRGPAAPDTLIEPIQIESVDVLVTQSSPPTVVAHVQGFLGDGCSTLHSVAQARSGNAITITILRERPRDAICTQIARLYDANIPLAGPFGPGRYLLRVNAFERAFTIP